MLTAAALSLLTVAGAVGFLATGGGPVSLLRSREAAPAAGGPVATGGGGDDGTPFDSFERERAVSVVDEDSASFNYYAVSAEEEALAPSVPQASPAPAAGDVAASPRQQRDLSKIVRTGRIGVVVDNGRFEPTADRIREIAETNGGFVQESETRTQIGHFVLRVPARRFDATITALGELGTVQFLSQSSDDVTAEFVDNKVRLQLLKERREVLVGFLREADTPAEELRFFSLVENVQLDIERLQGQLKFLNDQVSISTIRVQLRERDVKAPEPVDKPSISRAFDRAIQGFLAVVSAVVIGLGYLIPVLVLGAVGLAVWWLVQRRRSAES
jgi:hypothetical protein